jgi:dienelactone hydrolase
MTARSGRTDITLHADGVALDGELVIPTAPIGVVAFAHDSGTSRFSPRDRVIAEMLHAKQIGTLLFDLLTEAESEHREQVFDIDLLAKRLLTAVDWLGGHPESSGLPVGLYGASTGAAAAILVAAERGAQVAAVVSRGGRVDLAEARLHDVRSPTLLIVGERDRDVARLTRRAFGELRCPKHLVLIPGASHLFEEAGTLEDAAHHAATWFATHLHPAQVPV